MAIIQYSCGDSRETASIAVVISPVTVVLLEGVISVPVVTVCLCEL